MTDRDQTTQPLEIAPPRDHFVLRISLVYAGMFLLIGIFMPFFPVLLDSNGLSPTEIAYVMTVPLFSKVITSPLIAAFADRIGNRRLVMAVCAGAAAIMSFGLIWADSFWTILAVVALLSILWHPIMPLTESVAIGGARARNRDYGRIRLWGSLGFVVANVTGGYALAKYGIGTGLPLIIAGYILTFAATLGLPAPGGERETVLEVRTSGSVYRELLQPAFLLFIALCALVQASHAVYYLFSTIHWTGQGISTFAIGWLWAIGVIAEILLFIWSRPLVEKFGTHGLLAISAVGILVRWSVTGLNPGLGWLVIIQVLHGITFGAAHLAVVNFIADKVRPELAGTAQTVNFAIAGIFMSLMTLLSGPIFQALGGAAFQVMALLAVPVLGGLWLQKWLEQKAG